MVRKLILGLPSELNRSLFYGIFKKFDKKLSCMIIVIDCSYILESPLDEMGSI